MCRECNRERSRRYYQVNHKKHLSVILAYKKQRRVEIKNRVDMIKAANGCALCPEYDPVCLEFHHVNPRNKDFPIGTHKRAGWKWSVIVEEIAKCVVICSNCHKKVHAGKKSVSRNMTCDINLASIPADSFLGPWRNGSAPDF